MNAELWSFWLVWCNTAHCYLHAVFEYQFGDHFVPVPCPIIFICFIFQDTVCLPLVICWSSTPFLLVAYQPMLIGGGWWRALDIDRVPIVVGRFRFRFRVPSVLLGLLVTSVPNSSKLVGCVRRLWCLAALDAFCVISIRCIRTLNDVHVFTHWLDLDKD
jgi:hypothetical protein